jgi:predicted N-formylglutamate amidohydrolase
MTVANTENQLPQDRGNPDAPVYPLIGPDDPPPFTIHNEHGKAPVVLVCDHGSCAFPRSMDQLGVADWVLERHVAWDIGSDEVTRVLSECLDAPAVMAGYSRLIIDLNRRLEDASAFIRVSDGIAIPGNLNLDEEDKKQRVQSFYQPYHDAVSAMIQGHLDQGIYPALISIHSCTPVFDRVVRPWHVGVLWDADPRIPVPMIEKLRTMEGVCSGDNEPYSGRHPHDFTIDYHAEPLGLPHVGIEVRQDLIQTQAGARKWAEVLREALEEVLSNPSLYQRKNGSNGI